MRFGDIQSHQGQYLPSINYGITDLPERGISTYPAMYDPGVDKYVMQSAPNVSVTARLPRDNPRNLSDEIRKALGTYADIKPYNPRATQNKMAYEMTNVPRYMSVKEGKIFTDADDPFYYMNQLMAESPNVLGQPIKRPVEFVDPQSFIGRFPRRVEGTPISGQVGADFEPLIDPKSLNYDMYPNISKEGAPGSTTRIDPSRVVMSDDPAQTLREHGRLIDVPGSPRQIPNVKFNVDEYGKHIPTTGDKVLAQLDVVGAFMNNYTSPGGFTYAQLATLAGRGGLNASQKR
jgi:hypothetical protein